MKQTNYIDTPDGLVVETVQDCDEIIKGVIEHKEVMNGKPVDGLGYFVGTIPDVVVEQYMKETGVSYAEIINTDEHVKRILSDPDYKHLRVWEGKL